MPKVCGMPGHAWRDVVHENTVQWIAFFEDGLLGDSKYVSFAATSGLKGQPDMLKYDRAKRLVSIIDKIRASYEKMQQSKNIAEKQKATATYFIDKLALRVGGEKDTEEEADTVGCCSLRVEHLQLTEPLTIRLDFLGKDSIRYTNSVEVTKEVFANVKSFIEGKAQTAQVFDKIAPADLNESFSCIALNIISWVLRRTKIEFLTIWEESPVILGTDFFFLVHLAVVSFCPAEVLQNFHGRFVSKGFSNLQRLLDSAK